MTATAIEDQLASAVLEPGIPFVVFEIGANLEKAARKVPRSRDVSLGVLVGLPYVAKLPAGAIRFGEDPGGALW